MVRTVDYQARKRAVLAKTVKKYIFDAQPIASEDIARDFELSSATIRNIFAELEADGFLTHPHTSGGRIPTDRGYRYYVDILVSERPEVSELLEKEKKSIIREYKKEIRRLDDVLEKTSELISSVTHYASIVSLLDWEDRFFYGGLSFVLEQPEFKNYNCVKFLVKMIEDKQRLMEIVRRDFKEKVKIYIGKDFGTGEMKNYSLVVSSYSVNKQPKGRLAVLGPIRMDYGHIIPTLEYVSVILDDILGDI